MRELLANSGLLQSLLDYILQHFPLDKKKDSDEYAIKQTPFSSKLVLIGFFPPPPPNLPLFSSKTRWVASLSLPALQHVLLLLTGQVKSHVPSQEAVGTLSLQKHLHRLECVTSTSAAIGTLAENVLSVLEENPTLAEAIKAERQATVAEKKLQAQQHRENVLKQMKLGVREGTGAIVSEVVPSSIEELSDEAGFACMVCREGYTYKPTEMLGAYTFSISLPSLSRFNILPSFVPETPRSRRPRKERGYSTVSHFNLIHFSCHHEATRAGKYVFF